MPLGKGSLDSLAQGQLGSVVVTDTAAHTGDFGGILALTDTVVAAYTSGFLEDGRTAVITGATTFGLAAGVYYPGRFSSVTLASGNAALFFI